MVKNLVKINNKGVAYKRYPTLFNQLRNDKDKIERKQKSGVYKIPLRNYDTNVDEVYIGVTTRNLEKRLCEHKKDVCKGRTTTALAMRALEFNIRVDWDKAKVIRPLIRDEHALLAEALEIYTSANKEDLVNINQPMKELPGAWKYLMTKNRSLKIRLY